MTPILGNPEFEMGLKDKSFKTLNRQGKNRLIHFTVDNQVMSREELDREFGESLDFLRRMQLNAFLRSISMQTREIATPSKFENLCLTT